MVQNAYMIKQRQYKDWTHKYPKLVIKVIASVCITDLLKSSFSELWKNLF